MPQLLNHLGIDHTEKEAIAWGTLVIYTCKNSCALEDCLAEECVWIQNVANDEEESK